MRAAILIKASARDLPRIVEEARRLEGVKDAFLVFGRFDSVVLIEAPDFPSLREIAVKVNALTGVKSTETLVEAQSKT